MIVGVAILNTETQMLISLRRPNRHSDIFNHFYDKAKKNVFLGGHWEQGFIDQNGQFYTRHQAASHVLEIGQQLTDYAKDEYKDRKIEILFSEDVW